MGAKSNVVTFHLKAVLNHENMIKTYGFEEKALANPVRSLSVLTEKFPKEGTRCQR
jgi:hypothetical protein